MSSRISIASLTGWPAVWILLGLSFTVFIYSEYENHWVGIGSSLDAVDGMVNDGWSAAIKYLTGYVVETARLLLGI